MITNYTRVTGLSLDGKSADAPSDLASITVHDYSMHMYQLF